MALQSKITVYVALVGVLAMMGGIIYYASLGNVELEQVEIELQSVELLNNDTINDKIKLNVTFLVKNPSDTTFTVSVIEYNLYNNGVLLGLGKYSTEDVSMPGRASFFPNTEIPLSNIFVLNKADVESEILDLVDGTNNFSVEGKIITQNTWTTIEKEFKSEY